MSMTNAQKAAMLNHYYGATVLNPPANLYIGLSTTTPNATGGNFTEPVENGYVRLAVANDTDTWENATVADPSIKANKIAFLFAAASGNWGTATHWGIFTAAEGGAPVESGELTTPKAIGEGDIVKFNAGELKIKLQNPAA